MHAYVAVPPIGAQVDPDVWLYVGEMSHRTLNDYAVLLSMLRNASSRMRVAGLGDLVDGMMNRLYAAADAHRALSRPRDDRPRLLEDDLQQLCAALTRSVLADRQIQLSLVSEGLFLSAHQCWKITLVVSELVMNAARHAFSLETAGKIVVDVRVVGERVCCTVADNGRGCAAASPGRGTQIVDAIANELGGNVARRHHSSGGSTVILAIPYVPQKFPSDS
jgi:two-component sensor histidine kinase